MLQSKKGIGQLQKLERPSKNGVIKTESVLDNVIKDRNFLWKFIKSKKSHEPSPKVTADAWEAHFKKLYQAKQGDDNSLTTEFYGNHDYLEFQANPNTSNIGPMTEYEEVMQSQMRNSIRHPESTALQMKSRELRPPC